MSCELDRKFAKCVRRINQFRFVSVFFLLGTFYFGCHLFELGIAAGLNPVESVRQVNFLGVVVDHAT